MKYLTPLIVLLLAVSKTAFAHDSWVETDHPAVAPGESIRIDLKLGNHGNNHRDFQVAGVVDLDSSTLQLISPAGDDTNLKPRLVQAGDADARWWTTTTHTLDTPGVWLVVSTSDKVVSYAPKRSIKSAKAAVVVGAPAQVSAATAVLGHALELVPTATDSGTVILLFNGKPLADHRVSCIPRGVTLAEGFDAQHERMTDAQGRATFDLPPGKVCLIVAHHEDSDSGEGYTSTKYSATLTVSRRAE